MDPFQYSREYKDTVKFRCVDRRTIFTDVAKDGAFDYFARAGWSAPKFERYWRKSGVPPLPPSAVEKLIAVNFRYLFEEEASPFAEGRFNTADFPVLYTAKDPATAKAERFHWAEKDATKAFDYVVYSIEVGGKVADLRPHVASGSFVLSDDYTESQGVARELRGATEGIACTSARNRASSCCAFFSHHGVRARRIEETGTHKM